MADEDLGTDRLPDRRVPREQDDRRGLPDPARPGRSRGDPDPRPAVRPQGRRRHHDRAEPLRSRWRRDAGSRGVRRRILGAHRRRRRRRRGLSARGRARRPASSSTRTGGRRRSRPRSVVAARSWSPGVASRWTRSLRHSTRPSPPTPDRVHERGHDHARTPSRCRPYCGHRGNGDHRLEPGLAPTSEPLVAAG